MLTPTPESSTCTTQATRLSRQKQSQLLSGKTDSGLGSLPMGEWVEGAVQSGVNPLVGEFLRNADADGGLQVGQRLLLNKED